MAGLEPAMQGLAVSGPGGTEGGAVLATRGGSHAGAAAGREAPAEREAGRAKVKTSYSKADFEFGKKLGEGSYSRVLEARNMHSGEMCAIKIVEKALVIKEKKTKYVVMEKDCLNLCRHPNIVRLFCTFQDANRLYFVMERCTTDLFAVLKKQGTFGEACGKFFAAELVDVLRYMHSKMVIHRDVKPENFLLSAEGHLKITDFGTAKIEKPGEERSKSFVGTAEYVSPEILENDGACQSSDLWSLGCVIFQFFAGKVPFRGGTEYLTFQQILALEYKFPERFPEDAKKIVESLLVIDPVKRLGSDETGKATRYDDIVAHPFFSGIEWTNPPLHEQTPPPIQPYKPAES